VSVNLFLEIEVRGYDVAKEKAIRAAIRAFMESESVEREFDKLDVKDGALRAKTPWPVIISGSYKWLPAAQKALAAAVAKANGKKCHAKLIAEDGDAAIEEARESEIPATPGPLLAPKVKGFDRYEDVVARTASYLVFSFHDTLVTRTTEWPPRSRVFKRLAVQSADEGPDGSLALLAKGRLLELADPLDPKSKPRAIAKGVARVAFAGDRLLIIEDKSWKAKLLDRSTRKSVPVKGAPRAEPVTFARSGDTVFWNDAAYVLKGTKLVETMSKVQHAREAVPASDGGVYYLGASGQLVKQARGGKPVVIPYDEWAHWSKEVAAGPQGSLLLRLCENFKRSVASVFFPAEKKFFYLDQKVFAVGDDSESLFFSPSTGRVICVGRGKLIGVPVAKVMRFKKRPPNVKAWNDHVKRYAARY
jgi:hypothetical protein